jgi:NADPH:quinone reductase-like Zn-dependent oxidoreductase/NAD(P)-dependent dehydrogenase (short-subunit alcohol dehydrogenase family)/ubiquinone/menaquinone biosynthesis C-methylase UbiE
MFQLLVVAASLGQGLKYRNNLAVSVEELTLLRTAEPDLIASVEASMDRNGNVSGTGQSVVGSEAVLKVSGVKLAVLEEPTAADTHAAARQVWKPHVDFVPVQELLKPASSLADYNSALDELYTMALAYAHEAINAIEKKKGEKASPAHLQKYLAWLTSEIDSFSPRLAEYTKLDAAILSRKITDGANQLSKTPASDIANAISAVALSLDDILTNTNDTHDMLDQNNTLSHLDTLLNSFDMSALINILSHTKPNLRILELGAGSTGAGDTTSQILAELNGCYAKYTVSHSSASMLNAAKDRFRENQGSANMDFALLDIEKPLAEQGLEDREYDLIIANNVFHQIDSISAGLNNAQKLLHPEGRLVLHEIVAAKGNLKWTNFVFGTMPSWWRGGETDNRADEPYIDLHRWNDELSAAGFDAPSAVLTSDLTMAIVAKPAILTSITASRVEQVGLLVLAANASTSPSQVMLEKAGYSVTLLTLDQIPSPGMDIIALLDADKPFLETMSEDTFTQLKTFLSHLSGESGLFWLTQLVSSDSCTNPGYAQILGFARVLRSELGIDFAVCQAELEDAKSMSLALGAFKKFQRRRTGGKTDDDLNPDMEYLIKGGQIQVPRFSHFDLERELVTANPDKDTITLASGRPGRLNELHWKYKPRESLGEGDVEVEVHSSALSRRDVFAASEGGRGSENLGLAASGIVRCVGPGVKSVTEGDRVVFRAVGALSSTILISEKLIVKIPESLAFGDAAILADVYPVAMYGLIDVGGIQEGQSVLIHDGESEIGLAAIQIAGYKGAEVYTTVSSQEAKRLLMQLNVPYLPHDHILDVTEGSSTHTGSTDLFDITVLLNIGDISEDFLRASWQRVAAFGKLINLQIGRANAQNLDVDVPANRSYSSVNIEQVQASRPNVMKSHLDNIIGLYEKDYIKPLLPLKLFSAPEISEAFQYAAVRKGPWVENVTIQLCAEDGTSTILASSIAARKRIPYFNSQASYLLIGGLGGLGRSISVWMVENGARNLVFMSRSAGTKPEDQDFKQELQSMDCSVYFVQGDVTNPEDVKSAVNVALSAGPLKGIHQMSIVLRDEAFERMSWGDWNAAVEPKVIGTWNLHRETVALNINLDFFVFFSAISGLIGQQGQANYASANTFLDAFVEYRHSLGLAASAVQIGPVEDTGIIAVNLELLSQLKATGFYLLREKEVLDAIELAVTSEARDSSFVIGMRSTSSLSSPSNRLVWRRDPRMAVYHNGATNTNGNAGSSSNDGLKAFLTSARADPSILSAPEATHLLAVEIGRKVLSLLMQPTDGEINTALGLTALGLDSLAGTEMRGWFKGTLGLDMSVVQMMGMGTLETLGKFAADRLAKAYQV